MATNNPKGAGSAFDAYETKSAEDMNKAADEGVNQVTEYVQSVGASKKFSFSLDSIFPKIPGLDMSFLNKMPFGARFEAFLNGKLNALKKAANESLKELMYIGKDFVVNLLQQGIDMIASRIYITDEAILIQLKACEKLGSNIRISGDFIRGHMLRIDYIKTVQWIDNKYGISYDWDTAKYRMKSELDTASRRSCIKVVYYILDFLRVQRNELENTIKIRQRWLDKYDLDKLATQLAEKQEKLEETDPKSVEEVAELQAAIKEIEALIDYTKKEYEKDPKIKEKHAKNQEKLLEIDRTIVGSIKKTIVNSYGNLNLNEMKRFVNRFNLKPSNCGDRDEDFNREFSFSSDDVEKMAPFFNSHDQFKATNYNKSKSDRYTNEQLQYVDTKDNSPGAMQNLQNSLGDTRLVQTSNLPKYIVPRNVYIKQIYCYLAENRIFGNNRLSSKVLYERLKHPTMDLLTAALDDAAKNLFNTGLGKMLVDTLLAIEWMAYNLVVEKSPFFSSPEKIVYAQLMSYGQTLPPPIYDDDDLNNFIDKNNKHPLTNEKLDRKQLLIDLLAYYFENIRLNQYRIIFAYFFNKLYDAYTKESNSERKLILEDIIANYFAGSIKRKDEPFDKDKFINYTKIENIIPKMINGIVNMDIRAYEDFYNEPKDMENLYNPFYTEVIKPLLDDFMNYIKDYFFSETIKHAMTPVQVFEHLLYIYVFITKSFKAFNTEELRTKIIEFLRKYYSENACTPTFDANSYLRDINEEERREKLLNLLKEVYKFVQDKAPYPEYINENIWKHLLDKTLPIFKVEVDLSEKDFDIDDNKFKDMIYDKVTVGGNFMIYIRDFDNKPIDLDYQSPIGDLSKPYNSTVIGSK